MHITLLLADDCSAANATLVLEMLSAANLFADSPPFEVVVVSLDGQPVTTWSGQCMQVACAAAQVRRTDLILIPGFLFTLKQALPTFPAYGPWLREQYAQGAVLASMCTAAFCWPKAACCKACALPPTGRLPSCSGAVTPT